MYHSDGSSPIAHRESKASSSKFFQTNFRAFSHEWNPNTGSFTKKNFNCTLKSKVLTIFKEKVHDILYPNFYMTELSRNNK